MTLGLPKRVQVWRWRKIGFGKILTLVAQMGSQRPICQLKKKELQAIFFD
jgi:hypothetical protein